MKMDRHNNKFTHQVEKCNYCILRYECNGVCML